MESANNQRAKSEAVGMLTVSVLWAAHAWNAEPIEAAQQVVADLYKHLSGGGSVQVHVEHLGSEHTLEVAAKR